MEYVWVLVEEYAVDDDGDEDRSIAGVFSSLETLMEYASTHPPAQWHVHWAYHQRVDDPSFIDVTLVQYRFTHPGPPNGGKLPT
jgi:hypothetical protein